MCIIVIHMTSMGTELNSEVTSWNAETNAWVGNLQVDELYDEENNRIEESYHIWNSTANKWIRYLALFEYI